MLNFKILIFLISNICGVLRVLQGLAKDREAAESNGEFVLLHEWVL